MSDNTPNPDSPNQNPGPVALALMALIQARKEQMKPVPPNDPLLRLLKVRQTLLNLKADDSPGSVTE